MKPEKALLAVGFSSEEVDALRSTLEPRLGFSVRAVSAELSEVRENERAGIECVLVNLVAPRWVGEQTLALSRRMGEQIPIVLLYEDPEDVDAAELADNVWGVLPKSISSPAIAVNLLRAVDQFRARTGPVNEPERRSNAITGLAGRETLREKLSESIELSEDGTMTGTMLIGLDGFKAVNRSFGHACGDALLRMVAGRLRHCVRNADTLALWSSDEFAAVLEQLTRPEDVVYVAQRIIYALSRPFVHEGKELFVTPSIGIALHPLHGESAATLLQHADRAMYRSKRLGGNNYHLYSAHIDAGIAERLATEGRLRTALKNDHFELHYQPQLDVRDGRIIGLESLLRWNDPAKGLRSPLEFIPILEQSGLIVPVGEWVLRKACTQARAWQFAGLSELRVAVNLSPLQFRQAKLVECVESILVETGLPAESLEIELTESSLMEDSAYAGSVMTRLKDMGVHIALDDFGTGYSALAMLKEFPVDTLKIDRAFIRDIADDVDDRHICSAIVKLGHDLRLSVVAEGVENENQLRILQSQGCHLVQGFLYARPMPADATWEWLTGHKAAADDLAV